MFIETRQMYLSIFQHEKFRNFMVQQTAVCSVSDGQVGGDSWATPTNQDFYQEIGVCVSVIVLFCKPDMKH